MCPALAKYLFQALNYRKSNLKKNVKFIQKSSHDSNTLYKSIIALLNVALRLIATMKETENVYHGVRFAAIVVRIIIMRMYIFAKAPISNQYI